MINQRIKELAPKMPTQYLRDFFTEKDIETDTFQKVASDGTLHFVDNDIVVEYMTFMQEAEAEQVTSILRMIDFRNGDVNHFLEHLAGAVAERFSKPLN